MKNKEGLESNFNVTFFEVCEILKKAVYSEPSFLLNYQALEPLLPLKIINFCLYL